MLESSVARDQRPTSCKTFRHTLGFLLSKLYTVPYLHSSHEQSPTIKATISVLSYLSWHPRPVTVFSVNVLDC